MTPNMRNGRNDEKRMMENIPPDEQPILSGKSPEREPEEESPKMQTFFGNYESRLQALAMRHNLEPAVLKGLVEDAFGKVRYSSSRARG